MGSRFERQVTRPAPDFEFERPVAKRKAVRRFRSDQRSGFVIRVEVQVVEIQRGVVARRLADIGNRLVGDF